MVMEKKSEKEMAQQKRALMERFGYEQEDKSSAAAQ
jgi:hypothetical protein